MALVVNAPPSMEGALPTLLTSRLRGTENTAQKKMERRPFACSAIEIPEDIQVGAAETKFHVGTTELHVRNTFIEADLPASPSLQPFYRVRTVQTCPGARVGLLEGLFLESGGVATPAAAGFEGETPIVSSPSAYCPPTPAFCPPTPLDDTISTRTMLSLLAMLGPLQGAPAPPLAAPLPCLSVTGSVMPPPPMAPPTLPPRLVAAPVPAPPAMPALGTASLPSIGSALHGTGKCKPCGFLYSKGCQNGVECHYCHLCDSAERKRRRQAKLEANRGVRRNTQNCRAPGNARSH